MTERAPLYSIGTKFNEVAITAQGQTLSMSEWARRIGVSRNVIGERIHSHGWTPERAVTEPKMARSIGITVDGATRTIPEWCRLNGLNLSIVYRRIAKGWSPDRAVTEVAREKEPDGQAKARPTGAHDRTSIELDGETHSLVDWCRLRGMPYKTVHHRIHKLGWEARRALGEPVPEFIGKTITLDGVTKTARQWCRETGVPFHTAYARLQAGWDERLAVTMPPRPMRAGKGKGAPPAGGA